MDSDSTMTALERRLADDLERYTRGVIDPRPTAIVAREAVRGRPRARRRWSRPTGRLVLVGAIVATAAIGLIGVAGSRPSVVVLPTPSPSPTPSVVPYPLAGTPGLLSYQISNIDDSVVEIHLVGLDGSDDHIVATDVTDPRHEQPEWDVSGRSFTFLASATSTAGRDIWSHDIASGRSTRLLPCLAPCVDQEFQAVSRDGSRVVFFFADGPTEDVVVDGETVAIPTTCGLRVADIGGVLVGASPGATTTLMSSTCGLIEERSPRWSPTTDRIAFVRTHQTVRGGPVASSEVVVLDLASRAETVVLSRPGGTLTDLDWSPDGQWIVVTDGTGLTRVHADGTGEEALIEAGTDATSHPRYLPDGSRITFTRTVLAKASGGSTAQGDTVDVSPWIVDAAGGVPVKILPFGTFTTWLGLQPVP